MSGPVKGDLPPLDPINLYDVAAIADRAYQIKRALEAAGCTVTVETQFYVDISLHVDDFGGKTATPVTVSRRDLTWGKDAPAVPPGRAQRKKGVGR